VTKEADVERAVAEAVKEFGRIDYAALVPDIFHFPRIFRLTTARNFAGIVGPLDMTWETKLEDWKRVIEVNTVGVWLCNKYELKQMMQQESIEV